MKYGVVGANISRGFSKEIYRKLINCDYDVVDVDGDGFDEFMRTRDFEGVNIIAPYNERIMKYLDEIDAHAEELGCVDTVVNKGGRLCGYNTTFGAFCALAAHSGIEMRGRKVLVVGEDAVAKTVGAACISLGAADVCTARSDAVKPNDSVNIIVNTEKAEIACNADLSGFEKLDGVLDITAPPLRTPLVLAAKAANIAAEGGLFMAVRQCVLSSELFTGDKIHYGVSERVYAEIMRANENIVLIGLPGCGKSVVGELIASIMGRKFIDIDTEIEKKYGSISYLLKEKGEEKFRDIEQKMIKAHSLETGVVIAAGGGAVIRKQNVNELKSNGKLFFIDRSPTLISTSQKDPLSSSRMALMALFGQRYSVYRDAADVRIDADVSVKEVADSVISKFKRQSAVGRLKFLVISGPSVMLLGMGDGRETYSDICVKIKSHAETLGVDVDVFNSDCEGEIVSKIASATADVDGIIINPSSYAYTSIAICDALRAAGVLSFEVVIDDFSVGDTYKMRDYVEDVCIGKIKTKGADGYIYAIDKLSQKLSK